MPSTLLGLSQLADVLYLKELAYQVVGALIFILQVRHHKFYKVR